MSAVRPLRIGFVAYRGNMQCGGQGIYLWFLARELTRLGHTVDVFVGPPYPDPMPFVRSVTRIPGERFWGKWFEQDRTHMLPRPQRLRVFEPLNFYELAASYLGFLPEPLAFSLRAFRAVANRLRRGDRYDIVHDVQCLGYGVLGIRELGIPVVSTIHHPLTVDRRASLRRDRSLRDAIGTMKFYPTGMQAFVARRLDGLFTSSEVSAREIRRDFGVRDERIRMVANGVDTELFRPSPRVERDPTEILCVGRSSDPNKGIGTLVDALARLPRELTLTLVDDDHPRSEARRRARERGCEDRLKVTGRVAADELVRLYQRASLVVVPSRYEGFGLPAVEAMACATPVVATAAGSLPEVLGVAGGGVLVKPDDPDELARGIADLMARPETRRELGQLGWKRVGEAYSWPRVAQTTAAVYAEIARSSRTPRGRPARTTTSDSPGHSRARPSSADSVV